MTVSIEWSGKSYTDQIDNLSEALEAAENHIKEHGFTDETVDEAEAIFAEIAFKDWIEEPYQWVLVFDLT